MFFYGTLQDPDVLTTLLSLQLSPILHSASISGYAIKMWGIYPALIPSTAQSTVKGMLWRCESEAHFEKLRAYETGAYTWMECDAVLLDGDGEGIVRGVRVFVWAGNTNDEELEDGNFDFKWWKRYLKSSVVKRR